MSPSYLFRWPAALPVLLLVPLVGLSLAALDRARARRLFHLVGPRVPALAADLNRRERRLRRGLATSGLLLALVAALQPLWGHAISKVEQRGVDCIVCLDVSRSMLARDVPPSRLLAAHREIRALAHRVRGDRLGLVVFAGEARLAVPLTHDMGSFAVLAELADTQSVRRGGTDLGAALETALAALDGESGDHAAVLLLSDGEDLEQRGLRAADKLKERGIAVHCAGFGTRLGSKIPMENEGAGSEVFLRDGMGEDVVSAMDADSLRQIAETTGGVFLDASARRNSPALLYERRVLPMARKSFESEVRRERQNRFQWPLLAAFALWMVDLCLTDRKRR